jgi:hypothetical protein
VLCEAQPPQKCNIRIRSLLGKYLAYLYYIMGYATVVLETKYVQELENATLDVYLTKY